VVRDRSPPYSICTAAHGTPKTAARRNRWTARWPPAAWLVVAIDMTLAPEAPYPACVQDANYGVRWLKWKAPSWNGDPSKIGVYGKLQAAAMSRAPGMRPRDARYNAIPLAAAPNVDATVAYIATRSPISNTYARFQNAEEKKRDGMVKNNKTFFTRGKRSSSQPAGRSSSAMNP